MQTQGTIVKIQSKGLLTIPKIYREKLSLEEGDLVRVKAKRGRLMVEKVRTLPYPVRSYTKGEIKEFLELDEKESKKLKAKGLL